MLLLISMYKDVCLPFFCHAHCCLSSGPDPYAFHPSQEMVTQQPASAPPLAARQSASAMGSAKSATASGAMSSPPLSQAGSEDVVEESQMDVDVPQPPALPRIHSVAKATSAVEASALEQVAVTQPPSTPQPLQQGLGEPAAVVGMQRTPSITPQHVPTQPLSAGLPQQQQLGAMPTSHPLPLAGSTPQLIPMATPAGDASSSLLRQSSFASMLSPAVGRIQVGFHVGE